ncbi:MAG: preprotein translocase subunit SecG [Pseudomonadota bacterium]
MTAVILTIHTLIVIALVGVVLLQRSEGGALGMGGGGGAGGGLMSARGAANALTRTTTILAALFFTTSMTLALIGDRGITQEDVIRGLTGEDAGVTDSTEEGVSGEDILDIFGEDPAPSAPAGDETSPESDPSQN